MDSATDKRVGLSGMGVICTLTSSTNLLPLDHCFACLALPTKPVLPEHPYSKALIGIQASNM